MLAMWHKALGATPNQPLEPTPGRAWFSQDSDVFDLAAGVVYPPMAAPKATKAHL